MLSCVEGTGFSVCLIWVLLLALGPRVWAGGLSVAVWFVLDGVVGVAGVWVDCGKYLRRWGGALRLYVGRVALVNYLIWV